MKLLRTASCAVALLLLATAATVVRGGCADTVITNMQPPANVTENLVITNTTTEIMLNIPPRYMWGWGDGLAGYCGEFSLQAAGLYYGIWISAELSRYAANNGMRDILVGTTDFHNVATAYRLSIAEWDHDNAAQPQISTHLDWVHAHLRQGHPVIGTVMERKPDGKDGYDHIVPLVGVQTQSSPNTALPASPATSRSTNVTAVYWNDLWLNGTRALTGAELAVTRSGWLATTQPDFPIPSALPRNENYALAVLGLVDPLHETLRLKLTSWAWTEPDWGSEDRCNLTPVQMRLSATVYGLTAGLTYAILRFEGNVTSGRNPERNFLASGLHTKRWDFTASASQHTYTDFDSILSSTSVTFRAVLVGNVTYTPGPATPAPPVQSPDSSAVAAGQLVVALAVATLLTVSGSLA